MIICHDLGTRLSCYGAPVRTPTIDGLAADGVRFDRYFCTAPQCSPSRASIITGRHPHEHGVMGLIGRGWELAGDAVTLPKTLAAAGYDTWLFGFQHEHHDPSVLGYAHDPVGYSQGEVPKIMAASVTPYVCEFLRSRADDGSGTPWFASVGFFETHVPFHDAPAVTEGSRPLPFLPDTPAVRRDVSGLDASVMEVDRCVADIVRALAQSGLDEDTLLVFTTDHGIPFARAKCSLYDPGIHTALIARWPRRFATGRVVSELLSNVDLMPTLLGLAGIEVPASVSGTSFAPLLVGGRFEPREAIYAALSWHSIYNPMRCMRTNRYKVIWNPEPQPNNVQPRDFWESSASGAELRPFFAQPPGEWELYDLAADPHERLNRFSFGPMRELAAQMRDELVSWLASRADPILDGPIAAPLGAGEQ